MVTVRIFDASGKEIDVFETPVHSGLNRFAWDLHTQPPGGLEAVQDIRPYYIFYPMSIEGPQVLPGTYTVQVEVSGQSLRAPVSVAMDPKNTTPVAEMRQQYDALQQLAQIQERAERMIAQLNDLHSRLLRTNRSGAADLDNAVTAQLDRLRNPEPSGYREPARMSEQIAYLRNTIEQYAGAPTQAQLSFLKQYSDEVDALSNDFNTLMRAHAREIRGLAAP